MAISIGLAPDGGLQLVLQNRTLDLGDGPHAISFIKRILQDQANGVRRERGYIGEFPTQHIIDIWSKQYTAQLSARRRDEVSDKFGIDLAELDFTL